MSGRREAAHIHANFSQNTSSRLGGHPRNAYQELDGFLKGGKRPLDLKKELEDRLIQETDVSQQVSQQDLVVGIHATKEGFAQLRDLFVKRSLSQFGEHFGRLLSGGERLDHGPTTGSHHIADYRRELDIGGF